MVLCLYCGVVDSFGASHEVSAQHKRNKTLKLCNISRKQMSGNRKGVVVTCSTTANVNPILQDVTNAKIKTMTAPDEEVVFTFKVVNHTKKRMLVEDIALGHEKTGFKMEYHGPVVLDPKKTMETEIKVTFKNQLIGQFQNFVLFYIKKPASGEIVPVIRELLVHINIGEQVSKVDEESPYTNKEIVAETLVRGTIKKFSHDYAIPRDLKTLFADNLAVNRYTSEENETKIQAIKDLLAGEITETNYQARFHHLLWFDETVGLLSYKNYNMSDGVLEQNGPFYELTVPGVSEKRPNLLPNDTLHIKPTNSDLYLFEATVEKTNNDKVYLKGLDQRFNEVFANWKIFDVRFFKTRVPAMRQHDAIDRVLKLNHKQRIFPVSTTNNKPWCEITSFFNEKIGDNPMQRSAVEHIVSGTSGEAPFLLHGPPGTGKSITIVEAILQLVKKNRNNRILVCTESNMAADHVASMLVKYVDRFEGNVKDFFLFRVNSCYRDWESLPKCLYPYSNGIKGRQMIVKNIEINQYHILVTTLSHAAKYKGGIPRITHLFIDEAAQASEPSCLIPITSLLRPDGAVVLAGDPLQLGPVIIASGAKRGGLGTSLMERLQKTCPLYGDSGSDNYSVMLVNNYRSNMDILDLPNDFFYKSQLKAHAPIDNLSYKDILGDNKASRAIVFHGVSANEERNGKTPSFHNPAELEYVKIYVTALIEKHQVRPEDIGIVTPYILQSCRIKRWLQTKRLSNLEVGTVEAFQGKEKRVIIISTVRANISLLDHDARYQLGFLVDDKRFNVAVTRAKAKLIIIGNPLCLSMDKKWRAYMDKCREYGTYFGFDSEADNNKIDRDDLIKRLRALTVNE